MVVRSQADLVNCSIVELKITEAKGLRDLRLEFPKKGLTAIMGPNGSGKSTILHLLACLFRPIDQGQKDYRFPHFFLPVRYSRKTAAFSWEGTKFALCYDQDGAKKSLEVTKTSQRWMRYECRPKRWVFYLGVNSCVPDIETETQISRITYDCVTDRTDRADRNILENARYILNKPYQEFATCERFNKKKHLKVSVSANSYTSLSMGAGEQRVFKILDVVEKAPPYGLILIDEIDLLLHEDALKKLIECLKRKAGHKNLQIVFTAHNQSVLSIDGMDFKHIYQGFEGTRCLTGRHPEALRALSGELSKPINIFVEDLLAKAIVRRVCTELEVMKYAEVITFGAIDNAFTLAAGLFLLQGADSYLSNKLFVLDGDKYRDDNEKLNQLNKKITGDERERQQDREQVLNHICQLNLPLDTKPELYYKELLLSLSPNECSSVEKDVMSFLNEIKSQPICLEHHNVFLEPMERLGISREKGYCDIALLLSKTSNWEGITSEVRKWILEAKDTLAL